MATINKYPQFFFSHPYLPITDADPSWVSRSDPPGARIQRRSQEGSTRHQTDTVFFFSSGIQRLFNLLEKPWVFQSMRKFSPIYSDTVVFFLHWRKFLSISGLFEMRDWDVQFLSISGLFEMRDRDVQCLSISGLFEMKRDCDVPIFEMRGWDVPFQSNLMTPP